MVTSNADGFRVAVCVLSFLEGKKDEFPYDNPPG